MKALGPAPLQSPLFEGAPPNLYPIWQDWFRRVGTILGLLDSYVYQTPITGFSITIPDSTQFLVLDPAGTLATGTVKMPSHPGDGQVQGINSSQTITALTVSPNTGQSIKNAPTTLVVSTTSPQGYVFIYRAANTTWYRIQ